MLTNPQILKAKNVFKCNKRIMEYLVYQCHLPVLGYDKNSYYFTHNDILDGYLDAMPIPLKSELISMEGGITH